MSNIKLKLYLDDVRTPNDDSWIVVRNYEEFVYQINLHGLESFEEISLDHDLGETAMVEYYTNVKNNNSLSYENIEEKTGYDCCKFIVNLSMTKNISIPQIYIHSANPIGSLNMVSYINNYLESSNLPQTCIVKQIPHTIHESHLISPEDRRAKWDRNYK